MASDGDSNDITRSYVQLAHDIIIGHYRIIEKIGAGGMGEVYLAEDTELNRNVALKFLSAHLCQLADCRARFKREAQAAAKLNHPNVVTIYEVGEHNGRPFFAMEQLEGRSLRDVIKQKETSPPQIIQIAVQLCEGLKEAHAHGVVHRDIKPSNITCDGKGHCKILDFGLAAVCGGEGLTKPGATLGTVGYMSPEQIRGEPVDHRTDIFSLGVVLYELIAGRSPFQADSDPATMHNILEAVPEPLARYKAGVPEDLQHVVSRALEKDVAIRYQSAADMMADLIRLRRRGSDTGKVAQVNRSKVSVGWRELGYVLSAAIVIVMAIVVWGMLRSPAARNGSVNNHLAIIPFTNLGAPATSQAFCDGLVETLTSKLTQLTQIEGSLQIVPTSEVREKDIRSAEQARRTFGVNLVITGSIQQHGEGIRATLNLVDAVSERQLRSTVVDENREDVSQLQDSSVYEVAEMLDIQLRPESRRILDAGNTRLSEAYSAYLEGRGYLQNFQSMTSLDSAAGRFESAIKLDSNYALAYAGLGEVCWRKYSLTNDVAWVEPGMSYSSRAMELNDQLAPVLVTIGLVHSQTGQYQEAVSYLKRALLIDSSNSETFVQLANAYELLGRAAEAESTFNGAIELQPKFWRSYYNLARFLAFRGRSNDALTQAARAESLAPAGELPYELLGSLHAFLGDYDRAKILLSRSLSFAPNYVSYSNLGAIYQAEQQYRQAADMYRHALELNDKDFAVWVNLAAVSRELPGGENEATRAYSRAIDLARQNLEINPNDATLICYLADCYWQTGQRGQSLTLAEQAEKLAPDDVEVMVRVGTIFERAGRRDRAMRLIGTAVRLGFSRDRINSTDELRQLIADPRFDSLVSIKQR